MTDDGLAWRKVGRRREVELAGIAGPPEGVRGELTVTIRCVVQDTPTSPDSVAQEDTNAITGSPVTTQCTRAILRTHPALNVSSEPIVGGTSGHSGWGKNTWIRMVAVVGNLSPRRGSKDRLPRSRRVSSSGQ